MIKLRSIAHLLALFAILSAVFCLSLQAQGPPVGPGAPPSLLVQPMTVYFTKAGDEASLTRTIRVRQLGPPSGPLVLASIQVIPVSGGNWLSAGPLEGDTILLTANPGTLGAGVYQSQVKITPAAEGATSATVNAFLRVVTGPNGEAAAFVRPLAMTFRMIEGGADPDPRALNVSSPTGGADFSWTASVMPVGAWLQIDTTSGMGAGIINVSVNGAGLAAGTYNGKITVTSGTSSVEVMVTLLVRSTPPDGNGKDAQILNVAPRVLTFVVPPGNSPPLTRTVEVTTGSATPVAWTSSIPTGGAFLSNTPLSGMAPGTMEVTVNPASLDPGVHEGSIELTGGGATAVVRVFVRVLGVPGGPVEPGGPGPGLGQALRQGASIVQIDPRVVEFSVTGGTASPASVTVNLNSAVTGLNFTASASTARGGPWLNLSAISGAIPGSFNVTLGSFGGLAPGVYTGLISINITGSVTEQRFVLATLNVSTPEEETARLAVRPGAVLIRGTQGGANPAASQVSLFARGAESIPFQATAATRSGGNWLSVTPANGTAPADVNINVNLSGLEVGRYFGAVVFQATGAGPGAFPATLQVLLTVSAAAGASSARRTAGAEDVAGLFISPPQDFMATAQTAVNVSVQLVDGEGNPVEGVEVRVATSGVEAEFTLDHAGGGVYVGVFRPITSGPVALAATATASGVALAQVGVGGDVVEADEPPPLIFQEGVVNAANYAPGATPVAPGTILSLFGIDLARATAVASSLPLPRELGGVKVLMAGTEAPLVSVIADTGQGYGQVNFQAPVELGNFSFSDVVVLSNGVVSAPEGLSVAPSVPAIFTQNFQGTGLAAAQHADFSLITPDNPVVPGETIVVYATGLGDVSPAAASGVPTGTETAVTGEIEVLIGGIKAEIAYAGLQPQYPGLYQLNAVVPLGVTAGEVTVEVIVNGITSGTQVFIPVSQP